MSPFARSLLALPDRAFCRSPSASVDWPSRFQAQSCGKTKSAALPLRWATGLVKTREAGWASAQARRAKPQAAGSGRFRRRWAKRKRERPRPRPGAKRPPDAGQARPLDAPKAARSRLAWVRRCPAPAPGRTIGARRMFCAARRSINTMRESKTGAINAPVARKWPSD